jgi:anaerobic dimethyl sulfoxide reductase subunit B
MVQYGFYFDQGRCIACGGCTTACKSWYDIPPGPSKWIRVYEYEKGNWPNVTGYAVALPCLHCENPVCVDAANGAMYKESKYGAVLIDPAKATSIDLRKANEACPYGAIVFDSDAMNANASKCTMCIDRLEQGLAPICVLTCNTRALDFGPLADLQKKYGTNRDLPDLPSGDLAKPAVIFKARTPHTKVIPWDASKAVALWQQRSPLATPGSPPFFGSAADATETPDGMIFRNKLVLHHKNVAELMRYTLNDD